MKLFFRLNLIACLIIGISAKGRSQDTVTVQTFTWDSTSRNAWFNFPEIPLDQIERINMVYNMRCHNAAVGGNVGCYEWDYSCNTFLTDTFRIDSVFALQKKYVIPNFNEPEFFYSNTLTKRCISYNQKKVNVTNINITSSGIIGMPNTVLELPLTSGKQYFIYTASELSAAGIKPGKILGMRWYVNQEGGELPFLKIKMKSSNHSTISATGLDAENMTEVYFSSTTFDTKGEQMLIFYSPFTWNGTSSILMELSYNPSSKTQAVSLQSSAGSNFGIGNTNSFYSLYQNGSEGFSVDKQKLSVLSNEITVSFWSFGEVEYLPTNTAVFEGVDNQNRRQVNVHLPWSNGSIYWDCGNDGTGFDRIEKAATPKEYEGQWVHWAFTKNATTGVMSIYKNGSLWHSGSGRNKLIALDKFILAASIQNDLFYYGRLSQFSIWKKALDSTTIKEWIFQPGNILHPNYSDLLYYFSLNQNLQGQIVDSSPNPISIQTSSALNWFEERGRNIPTGFENLISRPVTGFFQGSVFGFSIEDVPTLEEVPTVLVPITEYEIVKGQARVKQKYSVYQGGEFLIINEAGEVIDFKEVHSDGSFVLEDLKYQRYSPAKFEMLSLVTPYGNGLDLGKEGKTFVFDVTDYAPVLRGNKRLSIELGGENQEELNIVFQFIKGKPARTVQEIQNVYAFQRGGFASILNNSVFEPRNLVLKPESNSFKIRTTVTGHEQNGEFTNRSHFIRVEGSKQTRKFDFNVWKECANNPIYPQGGTWIFDRAGWCPGAQSDVHSFDISSLVSPGTAVKLDYGLNGGPMDQANYLVSCQLVSYGQPTYVLDAGIDEIVRPNSRRVEFEKFNPSCSRPAIWVKNYGTVDITSIKIKYNVSGGSALEHNWTGVLKPLEVKHIDLPVNTVSFWIGADPNQNEFNVELLNVNGIQDENFRNNAYKSNFKMVRSFDFDPVLDLRTNGVAGDNSFRIKDMNGNILIEKNNLPPNTTVQENLILPNGCYTLEVDDDAQDGLSFWYYPNFGNGNVGLKKRVNTVLIPSQSFKADFGAGFHFDFMVNKTTAVDNLSQASLFSVYPNPAREEIIFDFQSKSDAEVFMYLYSVSGEKLWEEKFTPQNGFIKEKLSLGDLPAGFYTLHVTQKNNTITRKLIVE